MSEQKQQNEIPQQRRSARTRTTKMVEEEPPQKKKTKNNDAEPKISKKHQKLAETHNIQELADLANQMRIHSIEMTNASKSGHPTSCASFADIMSVLFFDNSGMHYDPTNPKVNNLFANDRFIMSKGHCAPLLYSAWSLAGFIDPKQLVTLRQIDSELEGHPVPKLPFVDVATGSLGQGLSVGLGMAYSSKYLDKLDNRYYVATGDGECAEGQIWEAISLASFYKLDNLTLIIDVNEYGQSQKTFLGHDLDTYKKRFEAFGWTAYKIDGHNIFEIVEAFENCRNTKNQPQVILAKTFKGKNFGEEVEGTLNWHGKVLGDKAEGVIERLKAQIKTEEFSLKPTGPVNFKRNEEEYSLKIENLNYELGQQVATRKAYGNALVNLSKSDLQKRIVVLDGDTNNSSFTNSFKEVNGENYVECFIAEQNMIGVAQGFACRQKVVFANTFAAFMSRTYDQARMSGISQNSMKFVGTHCGVSIGEDGPSQMALEDIALFRSIPNSIVLYPSDAVSAERATELMANYKFCGYMRNTRPNTTVIYNNDEKFEIGKCKIVKQVENPSIIVVGGGITVHEGLKASQELNDVEVIDIFSVKPIDKETLLKEVRKSSSKTILTVEDHYIEGGIYAAVSSALGDENELQIVGLGIKEVPRSGKPNQLIEYFGIDSKAIAKKIKEII